VRARARRLGRLLDSEPIQARDAVGLARPGDAAVQEALERPGQAGPRVPGEEDQTQILGDAGGLHEAVQVDVARERDADAVLGGRDAVEEGRVVEGAVPGDLEAEEGALVVGPLQVSGGDRAEGEHVLVVVVGGLVVSVTAHAPDHHLFDVLPGELRAGRVVADGDDEAPLDALVQKELAGAGQALTVVDGDGHVVAAGLQLADLEPDEKVGLGANVRGADVLPGLDGLGGDGLGHLRRGQVLEGRFLAVLEEAGKGIV